MITRSSIKEQIHTFACGNTAFDPQGANTALFVASADSKEVQTSDIATSNFVKFADLSQGENWVDLYTAKKYVKTNDSGAIVTLGDYPANPNTRS